MPKKVFIVDDDRDNRNLLQQELTRRGFQVIPFTSSQVAMEAMQDPQSHLPDVVLISIQTPEKNGLELPGVIKKSQITRHIPVIAMSSHMSGARVAHALASGFDDICPKPVDVDILENKILTITSHVAPST